MLNWLRKTGIHKLTLVGKPKLPYQSMCESAYEPYRTGTTAAPYPAARLPVAASTSTGNLNIPVHLLLGDLPLT